TATALQPVVTLRRRRATSLLNSGSMAFVFAWKNPVTFIVVGIATTKRSSTATIIHGAPRRPHHSSVLRMAPSGLGSPWTQDHVPVGESANAFDFAAPPYSFANMVPVRSSTSGRFVASNGRSTNVLGT